MCKDCGRPSLPEQLWIFEAQADATARAHAAAVSSSGAFGGIGHGIGASLSSSNAEQHRVLTDNLKGLPIVRPVKLSEEVSRRRKTFATRLAWPYRIAPIDGAPFWTVQWAI